jgi:2-phosphoglycerate kinase
MAPHSEGISAAESDALSPAERKRGRIVEDAAGRRRPFMRGIMIHSLTVRGVSFEEAFRTANEVRERISGREVVPQEEIRSLVKEILGSVPAEPPRALPPAIRILGHGVARPFSKGILSQSLLAAAIDPNEAFDVAREIEGELVAHRIGELDRRELRRLTYESLARKLGEQVAERYLVWRKYQEPQRPVILLIGGATGVGKTAIALEVAHRLGIGRVLSTDSIRQIMRITLSPEIAPAIHGSSFDCHRLLPPESLAGDPVIAGFRAQAQTVSVGIRASMDRAVRENASLVLDGVSLVPGLLALDAYRGQADVIFLVVATLDEEALSERFRARAAGASSRDAAIYLESLPAILKIQDHLLELADRHDVPIVDNVSFDDSVLMVTRHVSETLRQKGEFHAAELL